MSLPRFDLVGGIMSMNTQDRPHDYVTEIATEMKPYRFVESGLQNVYLIGVEYRHTADYELQSADIPGLNDLLAAIARVIVTKTSPLAGDELRFLRKRMRIAAKHFAEVIDVDTSTYSRYENGRAEFPESLSKLVRLIFIAVAKDAQLSDAAETLSLQAPRKWSAELDHEECIIATRDANSHWQVIKRAA
jgi:transcriptional regulator with XRE-family HTH domain